MCQVVFYVWKGRDYTREIVCMCVCVYVCVCVCVFDVCSTKADLEQALHWDGVYTLHLDTHTHTYTQIQTHIHTHIADLRKQCVSHTL